MKFLHTLAALLLPLLASAASADVVANYTFAGGSAASTVNGVDGSAAGSFTAAGNNTAGSSGQGGISSTSNTAYYGTQNTGNTEASAISGNTYFAFDITPAAGTSLQLTTLTFQLGATTAGGSFSESLSLRTSLDNFGSDVGAVTVTSTPPSGSSTTTGTGTLTYSSIPQNGSTNLIDVTVDLSSLTSITGTTELRFYFHDTSGLTNNYDRITNVTLNAEAIPEPATYALAFGACAGLLALVRPRKRSLA